MNHKELHPTTNLVSSVSLFQCKKGEITAHQILGDQQLHVHALEIQALMIYRAEELVIETETEAILIKSDYFRMDPKIGYKQTALEKNNSLLIR